MRRCGSLRLLSNEGMEGQQALNNKISAKSNGFSNSGRIPNFLKLMGKVQPATACPAHCGTKPVGAWAPLGCREIPCLLPSSPAHLRRARVLT